MINAPEFTEWSVAERRKFRCGAAPSGRHRRVCFRPFAVCNRRKSSGIDRGYADSVVVHEYVPENDALHLLPCQLIGGYPVYLFFFQGCEKAFHFCVIKAMPCTAETLNKPCLSECSPECFAGVLTSSVTVKYRSADLLPVLQFELCHGSDAKLLFHIAIHCYGKDFSVVAVKNWRYVQFSVIALYSGNVGKQLLKRFFRFKVPFDQIFAVLNLCCSLCCAVRSPSSVYDPHFVHGTVYRSGAYVDSFLFKSHVHSLYTVIVVVGIFIQNCFNFDRKKLSCRRHVSVFQPSGIARFAELQHAAHGVDAIFVLVIQNEYVSLTGLYFFRVFMFNKLNRKKRVRPLKYYSPRVIQHSLSSSRFLMRSSSSLIVTVSFGLCLLRLRRSASV